MVTRSLTFLGECPWFVFIFYGSIIKFGLLFTLLVYYMRLKQIKSTDLIKKF